MRRSTTANHIRPWRAFGFRRGLPRGPMAIMFTDIEGSVAMTRRLGDARAHEVLRRHNVIIRAALADYQGLEIKHTGDGFLAAFESAPQAIACAFAIHEELSLAADELEGLRVRVGVNHGTPVVEQGDIFGAAVQLAARLCTAAEAGGILVSRAVRDLIAGPTVTLEPACVSLRGFDEPVQAYAAAGPPTRPELPTNASCSNEVTPSSIGAFVAPGRFAMSLKSISAMISGVVGTIALFGAVACGGGTQTVMTSTATEVVVTETPVPTNTPAATAVPDNLQAADLTSLLVKAAGTVFDVSWYETEDGHTNFELFANALIYEKIPVWGQPPYSRVVPVGGEVERLASGGVNHYRLNGGTWRYSTDDPTEVPQPTSTAPRPTLPMWANILFKPDTATVVPAPQSAGHRCWTLQLVTSSTYQQGSFRQSNDLTACEPDFLVIRWTTVRDLSRPDVGNINRDRFVYNSNPIPQLPSDAQGASCGPWDPFAVRYWGCVLR